ncbi:MAG: CoA transferase [Actinobacteria bacterium]|nr:CoA transferase [Actinomycetota bacterium]
MTRLPLDGMRVADLSMMWAGPFATKLLAEMGADVLKIESPSAWDNIRTLIPFPADSEPWNASYYFNTYNRQKRSVTLDLAQDAGRDVFLRLLAHCDVLVENYRADVLDNLGIGYDVLRAANPQLVIVSMAGFGKTGEDRSLVGFGPVIEMMSGLTSLTGYGDDGIPYKCGVSYGDPVGGQMAAAAVVLGLMQRRRTGTGTVIDLAQRETGAAMAGEAFVAASRHGTDQPQWGNRDPRLAPQGCYRCADQDLTRWEGTATPPVPGTEEQWVVVAARTDAEWRALARLVGRDDLAGLDLATRQQRHDELDEVLAAWARQRTAADVVAEVRAAGATAGRVHDTVSVHDDPQLAARGHWSTFPHPHMPDGWRQPVAAWHRVGEDRGLRARAPLFGEHTRTVLTELLGCTADELDELAAASVIGDAPINPGVG